MADLIDDRETPLGRVAQTAAERRETRRYCLAKWDACDIEVLRRVDNELHHYWEMIPR